MIDYVFPYVNSDDPIWKKTYINYCNSMGKEPDTFGNEKERFRDWGNLLRFVFRSIAKNMPWINKIFFIVQTQSQIPDWLDTEKVEVVLHKDFIPDRYLPTYNSTTIEMFLWNIPNLSEHFIYGNDDLFALSSCEESDFFSGSGLPKFHLALRDKSGLNSFRRTIVNGQEMIKKDFPSVSIPENKYYRTNHLMSPMLKSTTQQVWNRHKTDINNAISNFRNDKNVNQYIYSFYQAFSNQFVDYKFPGKYLDFMSNLVPNICRHIKDQEYKVICLNDSGLENEKQSIDIFNSFLSVFNKRCKYEKESAEDLFEKVYNELSMFENTSFESTQLEIKQLYEDTWSLRYIPQHKYPWSLSIKPFLYNECFTNTTELKANLNKIYADLSPVMETIDAIGTNPLFASSDSMELTYNSYKVVKKSKFDSYILKEGSQYTFESIKQTFDIIKKLKQELGLFSS